MGVRSRLAVLISTALLMCGGSARAEAQFDLICVGWHKPNRAEPTKLPFQQRLRIDLFRQLYCTDACPELNEIARITEKEITLVGHGVLINSEWWLLRKEGVLLGLERRGDVIESWGANCSVAPFSGFGSARKF